MVYVAVCMDTGKGGPASRLATDDGDPLLIASSAYFRDLHHIPTDGHRNDRSLSETLPQPFSIWGRTRALRQFHETIATQVIKRLIGIEQPREFHLLTSYCVRKHADMFRIMWVRRHLVWYAILCIAFLVSAHRLKATFLGKIDIRCQNNRPELLVANLTYFLRAGLISNKWKKYIKSIPCLCSFAKTKKKRCRQPNFRAAPR